MATSSDRIPTGKLGRTVSYPLNGIMVTRGIGINNKKRSKPQLTVMQKTKVTSRFLQPVMAYLKIGYGIEARRQKAHAQNPAFLYHWKNAMKGEYPHIEVDYEKALMTTGLLPKPEAVEISIGAEGLNFSWNPESIEGLAHWTDQSMMIAYFPELDTAQFVTAGANRYIGKDFLPLNLEKKNTIMELYLSFISSDRQSISDSVYAGQFHW